MTTKQPFTTRDLAAGAADLARGVKALLRWLALVAAIAVGVCLGLFLFGKVLGAEMNNVGPFTTTTDTSTTSTYQP